MDAEAGLVTRVEVPVGVAPGVVEHLVHGVRVAHVLLDREVRCGQADMDRCRQGDRGDVGRAVRAEADLPDLRERGDAAQVADAAGVGDRRADEVDQLFGDELLELPDRVEDLADRQRHGGVPADVPQHLLVLRGGDVLEPEQVQRLQRLTQAGGLVGVQPVVRVVQQRHLGPDVFAGRG